MLLKLTVRIMLGGISMQQMSECGWRSFVPMYVTLHYFSFPLENVQYIFHGFLGPQNLNHICSACLSCIADFLGVGICLGAGSRQEKSLYCPCSQT
jgi:hypothetical protein